MCTNAPKPKRTRKMAVMGTSTVEDGAPPKKAAFSGSSILVSGCVTMSPSLFRFCGICGMESFPWAEVGAAAVVDVPPMTAGVVVGVVVSVVVVVEVSITVTVTRACDIACGRTILGRKEVAASARGAKAVLQRQVLTVGRDASLRRVFVVLKSDGGGGGDCRIGKEKPGEA